MKNTTKTFPAKYNGACSLCRKAVTVGQQIGHSNKGGAYHASCADKMNQDAYDFPKLGYVKPYQWAALAARYGSNG